ncbi:hypothetical protein SLEP1_g20154 [Rubroshorea leprosula]|uniref:Peroxin-5 n=1 Tax=Rubroshorea leprosula TaxID=152421 RepID=A0AAV5J1R9_9ROSI|nr:hypothetical protein SLEP1_g20154 [Rubroshorea leprosula]
MISSSIYNCKAVLDFLKVTGPNKWTNEFGSEGSFDDQWVNEFSKFQNEQVAAKQRSDASWGVYVFSDMNPYLGHENPMKEGQELLWKGLLSEAVLALEAEVIKHIHNSESWRLLGVVRVENDDDQQIAGLFNEAIQMLPEDADVHIVLGVLSNLSREYDKAIASFKIALKLKPNMTTPSGTSLVQHKQTVCMALDLKPNYIRAWANMGISYVKQGMYEESIQYYVRALTMNPKSDNAWRYLRISLSCASRNDLLGACDSRNLDVHQWEFPL